MYYSISSCAIPSHPDPAESSWHVHIEHRSSLQEFEPTILKNGRKEERQKSEETGEEDRGWVSIT